MWGIWLAGTLSEFSQELSSRFYHEAGTTTDADAGG